MIINLSGSKIITSAFFTVSDYGITDYIYKDYMSFITDNTSLDMYGANDNTRILLYFFGIALDELQDIPKNKRLILNFDGNHGSTHIYEETSNYPIWTDNTQIDTSWNKFGSGSLGIVDIGNIEGRITTYNLEISNFTMHCFFNIPPPPLNYDPDFYSLAVTTYGNIYCSFIVYPENFDLNYLEEVIGYTGQTLPFSVIELYGEDKDGNYIGNIYFVSEINYSEDTHVAITSNDGTISVFINGIKSFISPFEFEEIDNSYVNITLCYNSKIDAFELTPNILWEDNFIIPDSPPSFLPPEEENPEEENKTPELFPSVLSLIEQPDIFMKEVNIYGSSIIIIISILNDFWWEEEEEDQPEFINVTISNLNIYNAIGETGKLYEINYDFFEINSFLTILENFTYQIGDNRFEWHEFNLNKDSGIVKISNTELIDCIATGDAEFNASVSRGNIDGGGNIGWDFSESEEPEPEEPEPEEPEPEPEIIKFSPKIVIIF